MAGISFLRGEVARDAEDHHRARARNAGHALVALVPQRVTTNQTRTRKFRWTCSPRSFLVVELSLRLVEEFLPRLLELLDSLVLQREEHVGKIDADGFELVEDFLGLVGCAGDGVTL